MKTQPTSDDMPLFSAKHKFYPKLKWYQKIPKWIKGFFIKPKFSAGALETYEK